MTAPPTIPSTPPGTLFIFSLFIFILLVFPLDAAYIAVKIYLLYVLGNTLPQYGHLSEPPSRVRVAPQLGHLPRSRAFLFSAAGTDIGVILSAPSNV